MHTSADIIYTTRTLSVPNSSYRENAAKMGGLRIQREWGDIKNGGDEKRMGGMKVVANYAPVLARAEAPPINKE